MNSSKFRALALEVEGSVEASHMRHPDFRVHDRIFASLPEDESFGVVNLIPDDQDRLIEKYPTQLEPLNGAWGRQGWTKVLFENARAASVRECIAAAAAKVTAKPRRKTPPSSKR